MPPLKTPTAATPPTPAAAVAAAACNWSKAATESAFLRNCPKLVRVGSEHYGKPGDERAAGTRQ